MSVGPFNDRYLEHLRRPPRPGRWPAGTANVLVGEASDPEGERRIRIELRLEGPLSERIADARFQAIGCSATLVSASYVASVVIGVTLSDAAALAPETLVAELELPWERASAAELALSALRRALSERA